MAKLKFKDENDVFVEAELKQNKTNTISENSSNEEYPSAKAVFDYVGNIEELLDEIRGVEDEPSIEITTN